MRGRLSLFAAAFLAASVPVTSGCGTSAGGNSGSGGSGAGGTGTGGALGSGGTTGAGGTGTGGAASGGTGEGGTGTGGAVATGGTTGAGGASTGGSGGGTGQTCTFTQSSSPSSKIATVGIVTWSTTLAGVQSARIDFGLTTSYGMSAPVDLTQPSYRTLLLGMNASHTYHYRITATNGSGDCQSPDYMIMTGPLANGLVKPTVTTNNAAALSGGFLITGQYVQNSNGLAPGYILDSDGDIVWWYNIEDYVTGVVMDYAGTHMWINNHPPNLADAKVHRVSMDGITDEDLSSQMYELSHQLTVMPDESVLFYAADSGSEGCSDIKERAPNGTVRTIVNSQKPLGTTGQCHVNNIQYSSADDTLVFSDHIHCAVAKIKRSDGSVVWILNGATKTFTGDGWLGSEHGIHILGLDDFLIFNNNSRSVAGTTIPQSMGTGDGSGALEIKLDLSAKTVTKIWS